MVLNYDLMLFMRETSPLMRGDFFLFYSIAQKVLSQINLSGCGQILIRGMQMIP